MNNQDLEVLHQTVIRQAAELTKAHAEIEGFKEMVRDLQQRVSEGQEELNKLRPPAQTYNEILAAVKKCFLNGSIPLPAIVAAKKQVATVTVSEPECAALSGMRILPFRVTYRVGSSEYDANFVLVPALEPNRGLNEIFPDYKPAVWEAQKIPVRRKKKKEEKK